MFTWRQKLHQMPHSDAMRWQSGVCYGNIGWEAQHQRDVWWIEKDGYTVRLLIAQTHSLMLPHFSQMQTHTRSPHSLSCLPFREDCWFLTADLWLPPCSHLNGEHVSLSQRGGGDVAATSLLLLLRRPSLVLSSLQQSPRPSLPLFVLVFCACFCLRAPAVCLSASLPHTVCVSVCARLSFTCWRMSVLQLGKGLTLCCQCPLIGEAFLQRTCAARMGRKGQLEILGTEF